MHTLPSCEVMWWGPHNASRKQNDKFCNERWLATPASETIFTATRNMPGVLLVNTSCPADGLVAARPMHVGNLDLTRIDQVGCWSFICFFFLSAQLTLSKLKSPRFQRSVCSCMHLVYLSAAVLITCAVSVQTRSSTPDCKNRSLRPP